MRPFVEVSIMTYIRVINEDRAQGQLAETYRRIAGARGGVANLMTAQSLNPLALDAHFEFYKLLMFGRSELDRRTREMIGVVVSAANQCTYGATHHGQTLRSYGVDDAVIESLMRGESPGEHVTATLRALLDHARKLTLNPVPDEARVMHLKELGWSDSAILDATMVASYINFANRIVAGLGVTLEAQSHETCGPLDEGDA